MNLKFICMYMYLITFVKLPELIILISLAIYTHMIKLVKPIIYFYFKFNSI